MHSNAVYCAAKCSIVGRFELPQTNASSALKGDPYGMERWQVNGSGSLIYIYIYTYAYSILIVCRAFLLRHMSLQLWGHSLESLNLLMSAMYYLRRPQHITIDKSKQMMMTSQRVPAAHAKVTIPDYPRNASAVFYTISKCYVNSAIHHTILGSHLHAKMLKWPSPNSQFWSASRVHQESLDWS